MEYSKDVNARYLAMRITANRQNQTMGITYDKAMTTTKTTKAAIDWWLIELTK